MERTHHNGMHPITATTFRCFYFSARFQAKRFDCLHRCKRMSHRFALLWFVLKVLYGTAQILGPWRSTCDLAPVCHSALHYTEGLKDACEHCVDFPTQGQRWKARCSLQHTWRTSSRSRVLLNGLSQAWLQYLAGRSKEHLGPHCSPKIEVTSLVEDLFKRPCSHQRCQSHCRRPQKDYCPHVKILVWFWWWAEGLCIPTKHCSRDTVFLIHKYFLTYLPGLSKSHPLNQSVVLMVAWNHICICPPPCMLFPSIPGSMGDEGVDAGEGASMSMFIFILLCLASIRLNSLYYCGNS